MRKKYLDNIRWMTVVVVLFYHVFYMYNAEGIQGVVGKITNLDVQYYDVFQYAVYPWIMPILFIVSGICSRLYLEKHTGKEFARSRTRKLLVPGTIGLFAFQFIQGYLNTRNSDAVNLMQTVPAPIAYIIMVLSGIGVLWYIQILWLFSMLLLLVRLIDKDRLWKLCSKTNLVVIILLLIPVWALGLILNTPIIVVYRFGFYGILFFIGYFVFSHDEVIEKLKKYFPLFLGLALATGIAFCIINFGANYADKPVNRTPLFAGFAYFMSLAILGGMAKFGDFENAFTKWMSKRSFGLYVFHYLGICVVAIYLAKPGLIHPVLAYILSAVASFVIAYLLYEIISRIPVYRWMVLGIKKDKKEETK
ncbi:MAG: acyltransferase [Lachnospiraceae bacterium]|nr:acyltransferase [Lachnospiraceae bacterium]MBR4412556.1 acyltransferase [Lachnospiraceae bacterium]